LHLHTGCAYVRKYVPKRGERILKTFLKEAGP